MTLITNAPRLPGDQRFAPLVRVELLDDAREPVVGYVAGTAQAVQHRLQFAANGANDLSQTLSEWAIELEPNAQIEPAGTVYRITEQIGRGRAAIHIIEVPEDGGPYSVLETLIDEPGSMGSLLLAHLGDEADAHDASAVSVTPIAGLDAEEVQSALAELATQDATEATTRAAADALLATTAALATETAARTAADTTLTTNLATEATARAAADALLATTAALTTEATARAAADTTLTTNLAAEATARTAADTTLTTNLAAETTARTAADAALAVDLAGEATERESADIDIAAALGGHEGDTTGVHGITNTAALVLTDDARLTNTRTPPDGSVTGGTGAGAKIAANTIVNANVAPGAAIDQSKVAGLVADMASEASTRATADTAAASALAAHAAATTAHGVNTTALVLTNDARLSDQRVPTDNSVTQAKVPAGALGIDRLAVDPRARATHTGTQLAATISDLGPTIQATRLDQMAAPTGPVSVNGQRVTNGVLPVASTDLITKEYADALRAGLALKADPVRVMVAANVNINAPGAVHDSITLATGDRVLLTAQTSANDNGIYVYNGAAVPMTRAADANTDAEMRSGTAVWVTAGTYDDERWTLVTADPITLGVTALTWAFDGGLAHVAAGAGLTKTGNTIDVGQGTGLEVSADAVGIAAGGVTNTEVAAGAAIAQSKIAGLVGDINTLTAGLSTVTTGLATETTARTGADAVIQTAINNILATLAQLVEGTPVRVIDCGITVAGVYYRPPLDGTTHPFRGVETAPGSGIYTGGIPGITLGLVQARYPFITSLDQERDFAAFQLAIDTVLPGNRFTGDLPNGPLIPTAPVTWVGYAFVGTDAPVVRGALGFRLNGAGMQLSKIIGKGSPDSYLWLDGVSYGFFDGFSVEGLGNDIVTGLPLSTPNKVIHYSWSLADEHGPGRPLRSSSGCVFQNIGVASAAFTKAGWGVGSDDAGAQIDGSTWVGCITTTTWTEGNTTTMQHAWLVGNGTFGNIYGHTFLGCSAAHVRYSFTCKASSFQIFGYQGGAQESVLHIEGVAGPLTMDTARIEGSQLISSGGGQSSGVNVSIRNISLNRVAGTAIPAGGRVIDLAGHNGNLSIENLHVTGWGDTGATVPVIRFFGAGLTQQATIEARGIQMPTPIGSAFEVVSTTVVTSFAYTHKDKESDVGYGAVALWIRIGATVVFTTGADERQLLVMTGAPTGGTFTLTFEGQTTAAIAFDAAANTIRDALVALSNVGTGEVPVVAVDVVPLVPIPGINQSRMSVSFSGALGLSNRGQMTANSAGLTGGTAPTVTVSTATTGVNATMLNVLTDPSGVRWRLGVDTTGAVTTTALA